MKHMMAINSSNSCCLVICGKRKVKTRIFVDSPNFTEVLFFSTLGPNTVLTASCWHPGKIRSQYYFGGTGIKKMTKTSSYLLGPIRPSALCKEMKTGTSRSSSIEKLWELGTNNTISSRVGWGSAIRDQEIFLKKKLQYE